MKYSIRKNPLCPFGDLKWKDYYWERPLDKLSYEEYWCENLDPDGNKRDLLSEWDSQVENVKYIYSFLEQTKAGKLLDVGCGPGFFLSGLNNIWEKFGLDVSKKATEVCSKYAKVKTCELPDAGYEDNTFDVVTMLHVIEHLAKPLEYIKTIKNILKTGGIFILETPDFDSGCARRFGINFRMLKDPGHISLFTSFSLIKLLEDYNFEILAIEYPFFNTKYFTKENMLKMFDTGMVSPPFYGNHITLYAINHGD